MPRAARTLASLSLSLVAGCLATPVLPVLRDAGPRDHDETSSSLEVRAVRVLDVRGEPWPLDTAPRSLVVEITFSEAIARPDDCMLLAGPGDADLLADLASAPLRETTHARRLALVASANDSVVQLALEDALPPGTSVTLAIPAWTSSESGRRVQTATTESITISSAPGAGAALVDAWPPDGAFAVPASVAFLALHFDGEVVDASSALVLREASGAEVDGVGSARPCEEIGWTGGTCSVFRPESPLTPSRAYVLSIDPRARDATGARLPPASTGFNTRPEDEASALALREVTCGLDEIPVSSACARSDDESIELRLALDGAARLAWSTGARHGMQIAPRGDARLALTALAPEEALTLTVVAFDYLDDETRFTFDLATSAPLPTLALTEVRADPAGPEPRQEYVEVANYGSAPVDLRGLFLSDSESSEGDALPAAFVPPGGRALLVTDDFDPDERAGGRDAPVPAGTLLVRVGHTLGSGGLSNAGEALFLRDARHRRISASPRTPAPREGVCTARVGPSMRSGADGTFEYDPRATCTPGR